MAIKKTTKKGVSRLKAEREVLTGEKFDAMTDEQRAAVFAELEAETPEQRQARSRPMNAEELRVVATDAEKTEGGPSQIRQKRNPDCFRDR